MRKQPEIDLYAKLRAIGHQPGRVAIFDAAAESGLHPTVVFRWLEKWVRQGWWEYGTWAWGGWFTDDAPERLVP